MSNPGEDFLRELGLPVLDENGNVKSLKKLVEKATESDLDALMAQVDSMRSISRGTAPPERATTAPINENIEDEVVKAIEPISTVIRRITQRSQTQKVSVSKTFNTSTGNIFTSRTVSYTTVENGLEVGGLDNTEASIATQIVSLQVDKDSIQRAFVSGFIDAKTRDEYIAKTTMRHQEMIQQIYHKAKK